jgi:hypothetical protein
VPRARPSGGAVARAIRLEPEHNLDVTARILLKKEISRFVPLMIPRG